MASVVDICNLALARLGDRATVASISPPEGSPQADHCARFYPIARDAALSRHPWRFALRRRNLARIETKPVGVEGRYFALPSDCLSIVRVDVPFSAMLPKLPYRVETVNGQQVLLCSSEEVSCLYISSETSEAEFPSDFVDALSVLLASYLAGAVVPGNSGISIGVKLRELYESIVSAAISDDVRHVVETDNVPDPFAGDATRFNVERFQ